MSYEKSLNRIIFPGNYQICGYVGHGTYGKVYDTINFITNEHYAAKFYNMRKLITRVNSTTNVSKLFNNMITSMKTMTGKTCVITYYNHFYSKEYYVVITELCGNGSLRLLLDEPHIFPESQIKFILQKIVKGVKILHGFNIIHRDLKPENILFKFNYTKIKISDFDFNYNIKGKYNEDTKSTTTGTINYESPELLRGKSGNTKASDIWSIGMICLELCFGKIPFTVLELQELTTTTLEDLLSETEYSSDLIDFLNCCLQIDPTQRIPLDELCKHTFVRKGDSTQRSSMIFDSPPDKTSTSPTSQSINSRMSLTLPKITHFNLPTSCSTNLSVESEPLNLSKHYHIDFPNSNEDSGNYFTIDKKPVIYLSNQKIKCPWCGNESRD